MATESNKTSTTMPPAEPPPAYTRSDSRRPPGGYFYNYRLQSIPAYEDLESGPPPSYGEQPRTAPPAHTAPPPPPAPPRQQLRRVWRRAPSPQPSMILPPKRSERSHCASIGVVVAVFIIAGLIWYAVGKSKDLRCTEVRGVEYCTNSTLATPQAEGKEWVQVLHDGTVKWEKRQ